MTEQVNAFNGSNDVKRDIIREIQDKKELDFGDYETYLPVWLCDFLSRVNNTDYEENRLGIVKLLECIPAGFSNWLDILHCLFFYVFDQLVIPKIDSISELKIPICDIMSLCKSKNVNHDDWRKLHIKGINLEIQFAKLKISLDKPEIWKKYRQNTDLIDIDKKISEFKKMRYDGTQKKNVRKIMLDKLFASMSDQINDKQKLDDILTRSKIADEIIEQQEIEHAQKVLSQYLQLHHSAACVIASFPSAMLIELLEKDEIDFDRDYTMSTAIYHLGCIQADYEYFMPTKKLEDDDIDTYNELAHDMNAPIFEKLTSLFQEQV